MPATPSLLIRTPPPLLFAATLAIGLVLEREAPLPLLTGAAGGYAAPAGAMLVAGGAVLAVLAARTFLRRETTLNPAGEPSALVVSGPFRLTRNPMYMALTLIVLGVAVWRATAWPILLLPAPLLVLQFAFIPFEERTLTSRFGDAYRAYCLRVRRWI